MRTSHWNGRDFAGRKAVDVYRDILRRSTYPYWSGIEMIAILEPEVVVLVDVCLCILVGVQ